MNVNELRLAGNETHPYFPIGSCSNGTSFNIVECGVANQLDVILPCQRRCVENAALTVSLVPNIKTLEWPSPLTYSEISPPTHVLRIYGYFSGI